MKKMKKLLYLISAAIIVSGCDLNNLIGSNGKDGTAISAAVTGGNCTNMTTGQICTITITYNTNGVSGATLDYTPSKLPVAITTNQTFYSTFTTCQTQVRNAPSGQCPVTITYTSAVSGANFNLAFTLGSATSNNIKITGD